MAKFGERLFDRTTTQGQGPIVLLPSGEGFGYKDSIITGGQGRIYLLLDANGQDFEEGVTVCSMNSGVVTLDRGTVTRSTNADQRINLSAGTHRVMSSPVDATDISRGTVSGVTSAFVAPTAGVPGTKGLMPAMPALQPGDSPGDFIMTLDGKAVRKPAPAPTGDALTLHLANEVADLVALTAKTKDTAFVRGLLSGIPELHSYDGSDWNKEFIFGSKGRSMLASGTVNVDTYFLQEPDYTPMFFGADGGQLDLFTASNFQLKSGPGALQDRGNSFAVSDGDFYLLYRLKTNVVIYRVNSGSQSAQPAHKIYGNLGDTDNEVFLDGQIVATLYDSEGNGPARVYQFTKLANDGDYSIQGPPNGYLNRVGSTNLHTRVLEADSGIGTGSIANFISANQGGGNMEIDAHYSNYLISRHPASGDEQRFDSGGFTIPADDFDWHWFRRVNENSVEYLGKPFSSGAVVTKLKRGHTRNTTKDATWIPGTQTWVFPDGADGSIAYDIATGLWLLTPGTYELEASYTVSGLASGSYIDYAWFDEAGGRIQHDWAANGSALGGNLGIFLATEFAGWAGQPVASATIAVSSPVNVRLSLVTVQGSASPDCDRSYQKITQVLPMS